MVELFFYLASKWPKWCAQTLHPFTQILIIFSHISAPIVAPPSDDFQICFPTERACLPLRRHCKRCQNRPRKVAVASCWSNSLRYRHRRRATAWQTPKTSHFVASHRHALFDFRQALRDARGGPCHHFIPQCFSGPVNSLAARGKKNP